MTEPKAAIQELVRAGVAVAVAIGGAAGYLHFGGADVVLGSIDAKKMEKLVRPDPWTGAQGRKNQVDIAALQVSVGSLQVAAAAQEIRLASLERKEIPPTAFRRRVESLDQKIDKLSEQVSDLRALVGQLVGRQQYDGSRGHWSPNQIMEPGRHN